MFRAQCVLVIALLIELANSWEIAVSTGDRLEFYTDNGTKTKTVDLKCHNISALTYDEVHNILLYVDKQNDNDIICGYNLTSNENRCMRNSGRNIQGLAFDPVTETLFFTDTKERTINWYSYTLAVRNNDNGNLLIKMEDGIPTDIAVDICKGYVYWVNTKTTTSTIERARFDGSDRQEVFNANAVGLKQIKNLAIDVRTQQMFWLMPVSTISSFTYGAELNGKNVRALTGWGGTPDIILVHPNWFAVSKQNFYSLGCSTCSQKIVWKFPVLSIGNNFIKAFEINYADVVGIVSNYKFKDQLQGVSNCDHVINKTARENAREFYLPVCENFCFQGNCSFTAQGPICRCEAGYSGYRCEVNVCTGYCLNKGTCFLNEEEKPVCECEEDYEGSRCELPKSLIKKENGPSGLFVRT